MKKSKAKNLKDLGGKIAWERKNRIAAGRWGAWYITDDRKGFAINRSYLYRMELLEIEADGPLVWFAHLREKMWLHRGDIEDLIRAFDDLFGCPWLWGSVAEMVKFWGGKSLRVAARK